MNGYQTKTRTLLAAIACLSLTACGGGGGGGGGTPEPETRNNVVTLTSAEGMTVNQSLEGSVTEVKQVRGSNQVTVTFDDTPNDSGNSDVTFSIGQLENDEASRFEITTVSNGQTIRNIINLNATNTSATPTLAEIRGLQALSGPEAVLADDLRLANVALELEYLANLIDADQQQAMRDTINNTLSELTTDLTGDIAQITDALRGYERGEVTETSLRNLLNDTNTRVLGLGHAGEAILDSFSSTLSRLDVDFPDNLNDTFPLIFDDNLNRYTRFGNDAFGQTNEDGTFTFDGNLDFLNAVFTFARPATVAVTAQ
ncbi:hypothetical protein [Marinobacter nauticus]|uniref:MCE family protein n=1 Tax=Marinobacter nauticus TaxID=2743 RepID=A0A1M2UXD9_MARNT|nr:hypothetical protein [Marinobacter nauticus]OJT00006.1 hypothetical protein BEE62_07800 [Marinobacter nauticus]